MAADFFRIYKGLELDESVQWLTGSGAPSNTDTDAAPVGSSYMDQSSGIEYTKTQVGAGASKWQAQASQSWVQNYVATSISWREPVTAIDTVSTTLPTATPGSTIVVDGQTISNNGRVLFSNISGGSGKNIYVYVQSTGTFTVDANSQTSGDSVYVTSGTGASKVYQYDGTNWTWINSAGDVTEMGYIRSFAGKGATGSTMPSYSSATTVANNDSLQTAVGKVDAELNNIRTFAGKSANGSVTPTYSSTTTVSNGDSLQTAVGKIDTAVGTLSAITKTSTGSNITTATSVDTIVAVMAEWEVYITEVATPTRVWAGKVVATHNGTTPDHAVYGVLKLNGTITGLVVAATLTGGNTLNLQVTSTSAVNVKVKRVTYIT